MITPRGGGVEDSTPTPHLRALYTGHFAISTFSTLTVIIFSAGPTAQGV